MPIVDDGQHKLFMAGLGKTLVPLQAKAVKRPLLVQFLEQAIDVALTRGCDPVFFRNVVAVCVGYACGFRGSTLAAMEVPDLVVTPTSFRVAARVLKARGVLATTISDWEFYLNDHPRLHKLLDVYMLARRAVGTAGSLWRWPPLDASRAKVTESVVDQWVIDVVRRVAPDMEPDTYSSHSMRVGCASGLNTIGVDRDVIRLWVRWASADMLDLYIRPIPTDAALHIWFGWIVQRPPTMRG